MASAGQAGTGVGLSRIRDLDPESYERHEIHGPGRLWSETNCYVDVIIELLHGLGFDPVAALPFTVRIDFEGDQWTFFKFPHVDLLALFGLDIQEMNPWLSLVGHVKEQVALGRPVLVELDSFYLPDTAGTAYHTEHVKSTVAVNEIDVEGRHLGYFHGQGYHHLDGQDFRDIFQTDGLVHERMLPPYIEQVKFVDREIPEGADLALASIASLSRELSLLPRTNPFLGFKERFEEDLEWLTLEPIETFHIYSFANLRQYGACFELVETYLKWLGGQGQHGLDEAAAAFQEISATAKALQFQLARAVARKRTMNLDPVDRMAALWDQGTTFLQARYG